MAADRVTEKMVEAALMADLPNGGKVCDYVRIPMHDSLDDVMRAALLAAIDYSRIHSLPSKWRGESGDYPESKDHCADELEAALRAEAGAVGWQDIATHPKNEPCLVFASGQQFVAWFQDDATDPEAEDGFESDWDQLWLVTDNKHGPYPLRGGRPTHWQPLPPRPSQKE